MNSNREKAKKKHSRKKSASSPLENNPSKFVKSEEKRVEVVIVEGVGPGPSNVKTPECEEDSSEQETADEKMAVELEEKVLNKISSGKVSEFEAQESEKNDNLDKEESEEETAKK